jgi:hypothetical protein
VALVRVRTRLLAFAGFDGYAFPKGDAALDFGGGGIWFGIVPGGVFIFHATHFEVVVVGRAFPRADGSVGAGFQDIFGDGVGRKVLIAFDNHGVVALGDDLATPNGSCHVACSSC